MPAGRRRWPTSTTRSRRSRARAAALQVPGLVATLLHAAGGHDFERAAGAWHAEWPALNALLRAGGSAVDWLVTSLRRVDVDTDRMATNLVVAEKERTDMTDLAVVDTGVPDGPPIVWLGSLGSSTAMWDRQVAVFGGDPSLRAHRPSRPRRQSPVVGTVVDRRPRRRRRRRPRPCGRDHGPLRRAVARRDGRHVIAGRTSRPRRPTHADVHDRPLRRSRAMARASGDGARRRNERPRRHDRQPLADAGVRRRSTPTRSPRSWR